jgi:HD-GYP domain-containing protein (c-di-GMP phosphodiesterase class II)
MRFATRTFLWSFVPLALLLMGAFLLLQRSIATPVRDELRISLRQTESLIARAQSRGESHNARYLKVIGDNAPLKAGFQLVRTEPANPDARSTLEDQLRGLASTLGFDIIVASGTDGSRWAGIRRTGGKLVSMDLLARPGPPERGFYTEAGLSYQLTSVRVEQGGEELGTLTVGDRFDFTELNASSVLMHNGRVLLSSVRGASTGQLEAALTRCAPNGECELRINGQAYLSLPLEGVSFGNGYLLRSITNLDAATGPIQSILHRGFWVGGFTLLAGVILSIASSRSIVKPLLALVARLRESHQTGVPPEFPTGDRGIQEIRELAASFNAAAGSIRQSQEALRQAYVGFVGSLASALDARDTYTAGHSRRVSDLACTVAGILQLPESEIEEIRIGALLHDIGKIGISDSVLQKPGALTREEFGIIQQHPGIGKRILEGIPGFERYLPIIELHHENWDGTGYPLGLSGTAVPIAARIVHVVDAYDAMTSDRPYRSGMAHDIAVRKLSECAGTQFDPVAVEIFVGFCAPVSTGTGGLISLAAAVGNSVPAVQEELSRG